MSIQHITTLFSPSNTARLSLRMIFRSPSTNWQRKLGCDTILSSRSSVMTMITSIFSRAFPRSTVGQTWCGYSKVLPPVSYSNNFLCSRKISGAVNSGATVSTSPRWASGGTGKRSSNMSRTRGKQCRSFINSLYSHLSQAPGHTPSACRGVN